VIREPDGAIMAYCWSAGASTWEQIGEVVPPPAGGTQVRRVPRLWGAAATAAAATAGRSRRNLRLSLPLPAAP
jgi:hypothetical protein